MFISKRRLKKTISDNVIIADEKRKQQSERILKVLENLYDFKILSEDERVPRERREIIKQKFDDYFNNEFTRLMRELQREKMYGFSS